MRTTPLAVLALSVLATVAFGGQTELPVRSVSLFSSGVGYFQHAGTVSGDDSAELRFKAAQINDVLKSLVLQDLDGGTVAAVTYPSQDPLDKILKSFRVNITANPPLAELLNQLRGARVTLGLGTEKLSGTVVGVETRQRPFGEKANLANLPYLNLLVGSGVRSVALDEVRELTLEDPGLQEELTKALAALSQARDQDRKPVTVRFLGQGKRRVRLGYVVETPVWKTSYRLVLPPPDEAGAKPKIQGWAIVENQTEADWNDVELSLVSGRPISFVQDLYQPLYVPRPVVRPEAFASLRPPTYEGGLQSARDAELSGSAAPEKKAVRKAVVMEANAPAAAPALALARAEEPPFDVTTSVSSLAGAANIGELFHYTVGNVTLPRQKSAMLPIVSDEVQAERVSIYNAAVLPRNPLNGALLKNTSGKHLLQGPVTVFDSGAYGGDARIEDLPTGQERLLSYGVDLQVLVDATSSRDEEAIQTGRIVKGTLWLTKKYVTLRQYAAQSKAEREKTLIVEHPIRVGWKLVDSDKPFETTDSLYRFRTRVGAGKTVKLGVKEELVQEESFVLLPSDLGLLTAYSRSGQFPKAVREALSKAAQLKQSLADAEREVARRTGAIEAIAREQGRMRENMRTVAAGSAYYNRLLAKLNEQETEIEKLGSERDELVKTRDARRRELEDYLDNLTVGG